MSWPMGWTSAKMEDDSSGCPLKESQGYFQTYLEPLTQSLNMAFAFLPIIWHNQGFPAACHKLTTPWWYDMLYGPKVSLTVRIKSKGFTWKSSLNNATEFFWHNNIIGYSSVPIQNIPEYPNISQYSWLQLGAHPRDHLHDHPGAGLLEHRHSCRVKI